MSTFLRTAAVLWLTLNALTLTAASSAEKRQSRDVANSSSSIYPTRFQNVTWDNANWILNTTNLDQGHYQSRMSVCNGYHGINVAALGPFFEFDVPVAGDDILGWPLFSRRQTFATVGGFWDSEPKLNGTNFPWLSQYGWDTAISGIPHWAGIIIDLGGDLVLNSTTNNQTISNFSTWLDMKRGLMNWAFIWSPSSNVSMRISYQMFAHKLYVNQAFVSLNITTNSTVNVTIANILNGDSAVRSTSVGKGTDADLIYSVVSPYGINNVTAYVFAGMNITNATVISTQQGNLQRPYVGGNQSSIASGYLVTLQAGQTANFVKYVGIASTDGFTFSRTAARDAVVAARTAGYQSSLRSHTAEWATLLNPAFVDDFSYPQNGSLPNDTYIIESAITAVTNPYYMLQNTISSNATRLVGNATINQHSISVCGLSADCYAGQVFWDVETWMFPGLVASFPFTGRGITAYRTARYQQALANAQTNYQSSKNTTVFSRNAAVYPWTSGRFGNCTATGPCFDYEYHINGDIGLSFTDYWVTSGDTDYFRRSLFPVYDSIATLYSELLQRNGSKWSLTNMTDPDEYANAVDNGGFTMPLISKHLATANQFRAMFNQTTNSTWTNQAQNVLIDRDVEANVILEYTGMNGSINVKQADVVLATYPLSYTQNYSMGDSLSDLDYYAAKQSPDGPGMTYAMFSIIANQVSPSGCSAYTYQQYSERPYARAPWFQFSEQLLDNFQENGGTHPSFPFLTGHGGANQVVLFGYLGLRLLPDYSLHVSPDLPPQIPQIRYRTFHWYGWPISAFSNQTHTTLSRNASLTPADGAIPNATYANSSIPVLVGSPGSNTTRYSLPQNGSITISNRRIGYNKTTPNNIAQCLPVDSPDDVVPGQFPIGAVDGAASTKWQPQFANRTTSLTVTLPLGYQVTGFSFDWAQAPPYNYSINFHNDSLLTASSPGVTVASNSNVSISTSYNATDILSIVPVGANYTSFNVSGVLYTARYATLSIWGSRFNRSYTAQNMSGTGATVAEWNILVAGNTTDSGSRALTRREVKLEERAIDHGYLAKLAALDRYNQRRYRM